MDFRASLVSAGMKPRTINNYLTVMRGGFQRMADTGMIAQMPDLTNLNIEIIDNPEDIDPYSLEELSMMTGALDDERADMIRFWVNTGVRTAELMALRREDIQLQRGQMVLSRQIIQGGHVVNYVKHKRFRVVRLNDNAIEILRLQLSRHDSSVGWVWPNPSAQLQGDHYNNSSLYRVVSRAVKLGGVRRRKKIAYNLRHTYACISITAGDHVAYVSTQLGHRDTATTLRHYGRWVHGLNENEGKAGASLLCQI